MAASAASWARSTRASSSASSAGCWSMKALSEENSRALDRFADGLWLADGLARNTLESYRRDLRLFAAWLDEARGAPLLAASSADLHRHLAWQVEVKHA